MRPTCLDILHAPFVCSDPHLADTANYCMSRYGCSACAIDARVGVHDYGLISSRCPSITDVTMADRKRDAGRERLSSRFRAPEMGEGLTLGARAPRGQRR